MRGPSLSDRPHVGTESRLLFPHHACHKFCCLLTKVPLAKAARLFVQFTSQSVRNPNEQIYSPGTNIK